MRVTITLELFDECADDIDDTGMTDDAYLRVHTTLREFGSVESIDKIDDADRDEPEDPDRAHDLTREGF